MGFSNIVLYSALSLPVAVLLLFVVPGIRRLQASGVPAKGYRKLGLKGASHMTDEYDDKYARGTSAPEETTDLKWRVKALFIHPVKSCAPVELDAADVAAAGFLWDRKFAFAELLKPQTRLGASEEEKTPRWTFRTQRQPGYERLVHVRPEIWLPDSSSGAKEGGDQGFLVIRYPRVPEGRLAPVERMLMQAGLVSTNRCFSVPLVPSKGQYPHEAVTIWRDSPRWLNYGEEGLENLGRYLGVKNRLALFRVDPEAYREVYRCAPRKEQLGYQPVVGFADAYPVHLLNLASVRDLAGRVKNDIPRFSAKRFRSNIVVAGPRHYNEDDWKKIRVGKHLFYCACHTVRCRLPNVDPETSERHPVEPDKTLKAFRCIDDGDPLNACLGLQLVPAESETFEVKVGDEVEVLERGEHHYIKQ